MKSISILSLLFVLLIACGQAPTTSEVRHDPKDREKSTEGQKTGEMKELQKILQRESQNPFTQARTQAESLRLQTEKQLQNDLPILKTSELQSSSALQKRLNHLKNLKFKIQETSDKLGRQFSLDVVVDANQLENAFHSHEELLKSQHNQQIFRIEVGQFKTSENYVGKVFLQFEPNVDIPPVLVLTLKTANQAIGQIHLPFNIYDVYPVTLVHFLSRETRLQQDVQLTASIEHAAPAASPQNTFYKSLNKILLNPEHKETVQAELFNVSMELMILMATPKAMHNAQLIREYSSYLQSTIDGIHLRSKNFPKMVLTQLQLILSPIRSVEKENR